MDQRSRIHYYFRSKLQNVRKKSEDCPQREIHKHTVRAGTRSKDTNSTAPGRVAPSYCINGIIHKKHFSYSKEETIEIMSTKCKCIKKRKKT